MMDRLNSFVPEPFRFVAQRGLLRGRSATASSARQSGQLRRARLDVPGVSVPVFACRALLIRWDLAQLARRRRRPGSGGFRRPLLLAAHVRVPRPGAGGAQPPSAGTPLSRRQFILGLSDAPPDRRAAAGRLTPGRGTGRTEVPDRSVGHHGTHPGELSGAVRHTFLGLWLHGRRDRSPSAQHAGPHFPVFVGFQAAAANKLSVAGRISTCPVQRPNVRTGTRTIVAPGSGELIPRLIYDCLSLQHPSILGPKPAFAGSRGVSGISSVCTAGLCAAK